jgi:pimeloyl-ACP methyl ester carboxylesterase
MPEIQLPQGTIRYRDEGTGTPIVFIHGLLADGRLWDPIVPQLAKDARVVVPDLPLGAHRVPMRADADLTPYGLAKLIADFLEALDLRDVLLVGNDTGGGLCQITVTRHPERIGRLLLTPCDAFENFPPKMIRPVQYIGGYVPGALAAMGPPMRSKAIAKSQLAFGPLALDHRPDLYVSWFEPSRKDAKVRRDLKKVLRGIRPRYTLEAAEKLGAFGKPALIVWADQDRFFPKEHAQRLAKLLNARVETIGPSRTFIPLDQPERLATTVATFAREPVTAAAAAG